MVHKFVVVIEADCSRKEAQHLLKDIGGFQGSLPEEERIMFEARVYPIQNKPTMILGREKI